MGGLFTAGPHIVESTYDFASVDPNPMSFVFMHSPHVAKKLQLHLPLSEEPVHFADPLTWMVSDVYMFHLPFPMSCPAAPVSWHILSLMHCGPQFLVCTGTVSNLTPAFTGPKVSSAHGYSREWH